jgi:hypothetical protein
MSFTIDITCSAGALSLTCETALDTLNKVLELEQQPHGAIMGPSLSKTARDESSISMNYARYVQRGKLDAPRPKGDKRQRLHFALSRTPGCP